MRMSKGRPVGRRGFLKGAAAGAAGLVAPHGGARRLDAAEGPVQAASGPSQSAAEPRDAYHIDRPGADFMVDVLKSLGFEYVAANPGSSFRGLHESLLNYGSNTRPELLTCCHEESSVAMAHGYAKMTGKPMLVGTHDVVGLQHAAMAIYNAWCDRVPMIVIGGTGPVAAENRRPHIDWVHTANLQANQVRDYTKWDDQPSSVAAIPESLLRAYRTAVTEPAGPVYVCFDAGLQEQRLEQPIPLPDASRMVPVPGVAGSDGNGSAGCGQGRVNPSRDRGATVVGVAVGA